MLKIAQRPQQPAERAESTTLKPEQQQAKPKSKARNAPKSGPTKPRWHVFVPRDQRPLSPDSLALKIRREQREAQRLQREQEEQRKREQELREQERREQELREEELREQELREQMRQQEEILQVQRALLKQAERRRRWKQRKPPIPSLELQQEIMEDFQADLEHNVGQQQGPEQQKPPKSEKPAQSAAARPANVRHENGRTIVSQPFSWPVVPPFGPEVNIITVGTPLEESDIKYIDEIVYSDAVEVKDAPLTQQQALDRQIEEFLRDYPRQPATTPTRLSAESFSAIELPDFGLAKPAAPSSNTIESTIDYPADLAASSSNHNTSLWTGGFIPPPPVPAANPDEPWSILSDRHRPMTPLWWKREQEDAAAAATAQDEANAASRTITNPTNGESAAMTPNTTNSESVPMTANPADGENASVVTNTFRCRTPTRAPPADNQAATPTDDTESLTEGSDGTSLSSFSLDSDFSSLPEAESSRLLLDKCSLHLKPATPAPSSELPSLQEDESLSWQSAIVPTSPRLDEMPSSSRKHSFASLGEDESLSWRSALRSSPARPPLRSLHPA